MCQRLAIALLMAAGLHVTDVTARPYPGFSGLAATADSAATAGNNPAGSTRLEKRAIEVEAMWFRSESKWESGFEESGDPSTSKSSSDTVVPRIFYVEPINENTAFSFTVLGAGFSDDLGDWPGRYFLREYDALYISALPSLARRLNDKWSVAGSVAITYASYEQERAVANLFDPGYGDGKSRIETDSVEFGFGLSALYEMDAATRLGIAWSSQIDATQEGKNRLSGLGPRTEEVMRNLGVLGADIEVQSQSPQSVLLGLYHEFSNRHAVTIDGAWIDFSEFRLSEFYFNGQGFLASEQKFKDILALAVSYSWPVAERWMLGIGGMVTSQMIDDEERTMSLRLDSIASLGVAAEWQWKPDYCIEASLSYMDFGDSPVSTEPIPGLGTFSGKYVSRATYLLQVSLKYGG
ncbi:OmpP1/FadL family transporter [Haliea sp. E17]|uniref:OmpP1/FadL family transporter n=1 Tax=Haliea sp. E17 TaxID=3401576 RepID=UPI003AAAD4F3